jgi:hypothetical protein
VGHDTGIMQFPSPILNKTTADITNMSLDNNGTGMNLQSARKTSSETYLFLHHLVLDVIASKATAIAKTTRAPGCWSSMVRLRDA